MDFLPLNYNRYNGVLYLGVAAYILALGRRTALLKNCLAFPANQRTVAEGRYSYKAHFRTRPILLFPREGAAVSAAPGAGEFLNAEAAAAVEVGGVLVGVGAQGAQVQGGHQAVQEGAGVALPGVIGVRVEVLHGARVAADDQARRAEGQAADLSGVELPVRVGAVAAQGGLKTGRVGEHGAGQ